MIKTTMRFYLSILATITVFIFAAVSPTSCNKDNASSLEGTTWTATQTTHGSTYSYTLTFGKSSFSMKFTAPTGSDGGTETVMYAGTYTYDDPVVTLNTEIDGKKTTLNGVRDGNKLTFTGLDAPTFSKVK